MTRLFRELQIARFNELYYQRRSKQVRFWGNAANIISAIAASAVLANLLTTNGQLFGIGPTLWKILTGIAAIFAAAGPILGLEVKAGQMEKAALGHSIVKDRLHRLLTDLKLSDLDESHLARDREIDSFRAALASLDESPVEKLRNQCWDQTLEEFPPAQAWTLI